MPPADWADGWPTTSPRRTPSARRAPVESRNLIPKLGVGQAPNVSRFAFPDDRIPPSKRMRFGMPIDAVVANVEETAGVVTKVGETARRKGVPWPHPSQMIGSPGPVFGERVSGSRLGELFGLRGVAPAIGQLKEVGGGSEVSVSAIALPPSRRRRRVQIVGPSESSAADRG